MKQDLQMVAPCLFGLESIVAHELKNMGAVDVKSQDGRVMFSGGAGLLARSNIRHRTAERICLVLGEFEARTFTELFDAVEKLELERFIGKYNAFPVKGWSLKSTLHSIPSCQSIIKKAAAKRLGKKYGLQTLPETGPVVQIQFSIHNDKVSIMLDTSGEGLHKRGYRTQANLAPIKETLAAGIADFARVRSAGTVVDPMCGSGTFLIESALRNRNIAPGLTRAFSAERWGSIPSRIWKEERESALGDIRFDKEFCAIGYDIDPEAVRMTQENAKRAGVSSSVRAEVQDISKLAAGKGDIVICNPPYGERLSNESEAEQLYRQMGSVLRKSGAKYYIISPHEEFEYFFGKRATKKRKLYNGMIQCNLFLYE